MGVLIGAGTRARIPAGGLVFGPDGGSAKIELAYDMFPQWLLIAVGHAEESERLSVRVDELWDAPADSGLIEAIEAEVRSAMQAIIASAAAIDGFYAFLCEYVPDARPSGRRGQSSRWSRIAEVMKHCFAIKPSTLSEIRTRLEALFSLRDEAVHPAAAHRDPLLHPRHPIGVDRQFALFQRDNAVRAVASAMGIIDGLIRRPKSGHANLVTNCEFAQERLAPMVERWEMNHPRAWAEQG